MFVMTKLAVVVRIDSKIGLSAIDERRDGDANGGRKKNGLEDDHIVNYKWMDI